MAVKYVKYQNQNESSAAYGKTFLRAVQDETIDIAGLADHMAEHNTVFSKGIIVGVLTDMSRCIRELLLSSKAIKINDLCILRLGFSCNGADTPEKATVKNITGLNINSMGTGAMAVKSLINNVQFKELKKYTGLESETETEENPGGNGGGGNSQQGSGEQNQGEQNQGGGSQQAAPKYTLTLKRANDTVISTTELEAGAAITYPTATTGYMWPVDAPTVMPAQATTVTEVVDDDPNVL